MYSPEGGGVGGGGGDNGTPLDFFFLVAQFYCTLTIYFGWFALFTGVCCDLWNIPGK